MTLSQVISETYSFLSNEVENKKIKLTSTEKTFYSSLTYVLSQLDEMDDNEKQPILTKLCNIKDTICAKQQNNDPQQSGLYLNHLSLDNLKDHLHIVENSQGKLPTYLYFNPKIINNFDQNDSDNQGFLTLLKHLRFCATKGQNGIKFLKNSDIKCELSINNKLTNLTITHELKLVGSLKRISLATESNSPNESTILFATHYLEKGFHNSASKQKTYRTNLELINGKLDIKKSTINSTYCFHKPETNKIQTTLTLEKPTGVAQLKI